MRSFRNFPKDGIELLKASPKNKKRSPRMDNMAMTDSRHYLKLSCDASDSLLVFLESTRLLEFWLDIFDSLFYDAFSVTRLYSVDDRVTRE
jgi:hypothetical protein